MSAIAIAALTMNAMLSGFIGSEIFLEVIVMAPIIDAMSPDAPMSIGYRTRGLTSMPMTGSVVSPNLSPPIACRDAGTIRAPSSIAASIVTMYDS